MSFLWLHKYKIMSFFSCRWFSRTVPDVLTLSTPMAFPTASRQKACPTRMAPSTGTNTTMRFSPIPPLRIYGKSVLRLGQQAKSRTVEPGRTIRASILWVHCSWNFLALTQTCPFFFNWTQKRGNSHLYFKKAILNLVLFLSPRKGISTLAWLGLCLCVGRAPWTRRQQTQGSLCCFSWPLTSLRAGTTQKTMKQYSGKPEGELWTATTKRTSSFIVLTFCLLIVNYYPPVPAFYNILLLFFFLSHQWHHIQPKRPEDVHRSACKLALDQHGFSHRLSERPLPWTDIPPQEDHQLQTGRLPSATWLES